MKICVLMGSPRKKDGYNVCRIIEGSFSGGSAVEFEYLFLKEYAVEECRGCDQCFQKGEAFCPCKDELPALKEKLLRADGIIFVSPVYACQITGLMKRVLDRLSYLFHRQEFVGKPALTVVTTGGGGQKPTGEYLKMTACGWGCHLTGEISIVSPMFFPGAQKPVRGYHAKYRAASILKIQKAARDFEKAINSKLPDPSFYDLFLFQCLRSKTFVSTADYRFWKEKGWLDSLYFYPVRLNPFQAAFARAVRLYVNFLAKKMLPDQTD